MPALIALFSYFLGIEILFGVSPLAIIAEWAKPLHGVPWLVDASGAAVRSGALVDPTTALA